MQKTVFIFLFSVSIHLSWSQTATDSRSFEKRNSFWTETVVNGVIKDKWRWQLDFQYRRSSDPSNVVGGSSNPFKNNFQHVYRPWVHYQMNENIRLSLSPIGFWESYYGAGEGNGVRKVQPEFRICPQITLSNKILSRVMVDHRFRYEFRFFGTKTATDKFEFSDYGYGMDFPSTGRKQRMRYFVRAIIPLNHKTLEPNTFYFVGWNELFLGIGANTANDKIWDQNRCFMMLGFKPKWNFPMRFELGYASVWKNTFTSSINAQGQFVETGSVIEKNNVLQVYVIFENFNKLFEKKK